MPCRALGTFPQCEIDLVFIDYELSQCPVGLWGLFHSGKKSDLVTRLQNGRNALSGSGDFSTAAIFAIGGGRLARSQCPVGLWGLFHSPCGSTYWVTF